MRFSAPRCRVSPCRLLPLALLQVGGGEVCGLTTGAKALFCFTADTMLAGENEKIPEELLQLEGRLVEEAMVGLDGTTLEKTKKQPTTLKQRAGWNMSRQFPGFLFMYVFIFLIR